MSGDPLADVHPLFREGMKHFIRDVAIWKDKTVKQAFIKNECPRCNAKLVNSINDLHFRSNANAKPEIFESMRYTVNVYCKECLPK